jgi:hypothetical protein
MPVNTSSPSLRAIQPLRSVGRPPAAGRDRDQRQRHHGRRRITMSAPCQDFGGAGRRPGNAQQPFLRLIECCHIRSRRWGRAAAGRRGLHADRYQRALHGFLAVEPMAHVQHPVDQVEVHALDAGHAFQLVADQALFGRAKHFVDAVTRYLRAGIEARPNLFDVVCHHALSISGVGFIKNHLSTTGSSVQGPTRQRML